LSRLDLRFNQAYWALFAQLGAPGKHDLRQEDLHFVQDVQIQCGVPESGATPSVTDAELRDCIKAAYEKERVLWLSRLRSPASEEATRPIDEHFLLQLRLQALGFLPLATPIRGVYGMETRSAIIRWQQSRNRSPTGILSNADAAALMQEPLDPELATQVRAQAERECTQRGAELAHDEAEAQQQAAAQAEEDRQRAQKEAEDAEQAKLAARKAAEDAIEAQKQRVNASFTAFENKTVAPNDNIAKLLNYSTFGSNNGSADSFWAAKTRQSSVYVLYQKGSNLQTPVDTIKQVDVSKIDPSKFFITEHGEGVSVISDGVTLAECQVCNRRDLQMRWVHFFMHRDH
jgi:peptidoglycan hydrolase-like protein with peptidoglycan-binding domain